MRADAWRTRALFDDDRKTIRVAMSRLQVFSSQNILLDVVGTLNICLCRHNVCAEHDRSRIFKRALPPLLQRIPSTDTYENLLNETFGNEKGCTVKGHAL